MTAEIAIMNKVAVALAADSAVTLKQRSGLKVYRSTNKLFSFAAGQPIGIMTYGNAVIMGVPWETVIKIYVNKLGGKRFNRLEDYSKDFLDFLVKNKSLFPKHIQDETVANIILRYFINFIRNEINKEIKMIVEKEKKINDERVGEIVSNVIKKTRKSLEKMDNLASMPKKFGLQIIEKHRKKIDKRIKEAFQKLPLNAELKDDLIAIAGYIFEKDIFLPGISSGIVLAGFGDEEIFPALHSILIEGKFENFLKWKEVRKEGISFNVGSSIAPFAQIDVVYNFMEGIDPTLDSFLKNYIEELLVNLPNTIVDCIKELDDKQKEEIKKRFNSLTKKTLDNFLAEMRNYRRNNHSFPILSSISAQPPYELAMLAESLINLTSLKQRVTLDIETVGGPVDVAIITKGDGFVWLKKKNQPLHAMAYNY